MRVYSSVIQRMLIIYTSYYNHQLQNSMAWYKKVLFLTYVMIVQWRLRGIYLGWEPGSVLSIIQGCRFLPSHDLHSPRASESSAGPYYLVGKKRERRFKSVGGKVGAGGRREKKREKAYLLLTASSQGWHTLLSYSSQKLFTRSHLDPKLEKRSPAKCQDPPANILSIQDLKYAVSLSM